MGATAKLASLPVHDYKGRIAEDADVGNIHDLSGALQGVPVSSGYAWRRRSANPRQASRVLPAIYHIRAISQLSLLVVMASTLMVAKARADNSREGDQIWATALAQGGFGFVHPQLSRVRGWLELQGRWRSFGESYETGFLPRVALGYAINNQVTVFSGFAAIETDPARRKPFAELRPWQQLTWNLPVNGFTLQSRTGLEQRILQNNLGWRLRELVKMTVSVPGTDKVYLAAYEELFLDLDDTTWGQRRRLRQNRFFVGSGLRLDSAKRVSLEVGYLNQWIDRRREDRVNHVLSLNLFFNY